MLNKASHPSCRSRPGFSSRKIIGISQEPNTMKQNQKTLCIIATSPFKTTKLKTNTLRCKKRPYTNS